MARAFLRHAYRWFYRAYTQLHTKGGPFPHLTVYENTLRGFRDAVLRYGQGILHFHTSRKYAGDELNRDVSETTRTQFATLIAIRPHTYHFSLSGPFTDALQRAKAEAATDRQRPPPPCNQRRVRARR